MIHSEPYYILGYHGCDARTKDAVLSQGDALRASKEDYDWLGPGVYFWENDYDRAFAFAEEVKKRKPSQIKEPAVIGTILALGNCLNLLNYKNIALVKEAYTSFKKVMTDSGRNIPKNSDNLMLRYLDKAVITHLHHLRKENNYPPFDSIRAVFWEGEEIYPGAGFSTKNHIQLCIQNSECIVGYFDPKR